MLDEPYRWLEAINNRRDYIEDQLRTGSPVIGLQYDDGMLLLTISRGQRKIFEVHDRISLTAIGPVADIERLRMMATDAASVQGFQNSVDDVTLHRLTNFVLGPTVKQAFEAIFGSAYIIKMLLAELASQGRRNQFISLNYDGALKSDDRALAIGGADNAEDAMQEFLSEEIGSNLTLTAAVRLALETWAVGKESVLKTEALEAADSDADEDSEIKVDKERLRQVVKDALETGAIEAGVLQISRQSSNRFRFLTAEEIDDATKGWLP